MRLMQFVYKLLKIAYQSFLFDRDREMSPRRRSIGKTTELKSKFKLYLFLMLSAYN